MRNLFVRSTQVFLIVAFFVGWEWGARTKFINPEWFSPPFGVFMRLYDETVNGSFLVHFWVTSLETITGFIAGVIGGLALGIALGMMPRVREVVMPYLMAIYGIPRPALAPIFVLWFGIGLFSKIALIFSLVYFLIVIYVIAGYAAVNPKLIDLSKISGAKNHQIMTKIIIPSMLPYIFAGMKLGVGLAIIGAVVGEIIASDSGMGYYVFQSSQLADTEGIYVGLAGLGVFSLVLALGMEWIDRHFFHWRTDTIV